MSVGQGEKALCFQELHDSGCFVIPNPWDAGTAKILGGLGFRALATTSAGLAFSLGRADGLGAVGRQEALENARQIVEATDLPVSGDLENGWGREPAAVAEAIRQAAAVGLVGGSIEDVSPDPGEPIYGFEPAVDRVRAAAEAARGLDVPFIVTARSDGYLHGRIELSETIRRLQAFQEAGADVLYAPGLGTKSDIRAVVSSVDRPVNVVMGLSGFRGSVEDLADLGVRRISLGSSLARAALGALDRAAREVAENGTFSFVDGAVPFGDLQSSLARHAEGADALGHYRSSSGSSGSRRRRLT